MVKKNLAWKLAVGFVFSAVTLAGAFTFAIDGSEISTGPQTQTQVETTVTTDNTTGYSVSTYKASQTEAMSFVSKKTGALTGDRYERSDATLATTTTKSAEADEEKQKEDVNQDASVTTAASASVTSAASCAAQPVVTTAPVQTTTTAWYYTTTAAQTTTAAATTTKATTTSATTTSATTTRAVTTTTPAATTTPAPTKPVVTTTAAKPAEPVPQPGSLSAPIMKVESTYDTNYTHPYGHQTNQVSLHWTSVSGAAKYYVYVKNGQFADWTNVAATSSTDCTVSGLKRETVYAFAVRAVDAAGKVSALSQPVNIKTARMDYSENGWKAMCRIVFHEVGGAAGAFWDKPIVYVADCVANQYVCAKYTYQGVWPKFYSRFSNIESIIYTSGGFLSDANLARRGATYQRVPEKVKKAVWGAVYGVTFYNNIANDYNIFYWCNSAKAQSSSKIGYGFTLPWGGYMYIWRQYWR